MEKANEFPRGAWEPLDHRWKEQLTEQEEGDSVLDINNIQSGQSQDLHAHQVGGRDACEGGRWPDARLISSRRRYPSIHLQPSHRAPVADYLWRRSFGGTINLNSSDFSDAHLPVGHLLAVPAEGVVGGGGGLTAAQCLPQAAVEVGEAPQAGYELPEEVIKEK